MNLTYAGRSVSLTREEWSMVQNCFATMMKSELQWVLDEFHCMKSPITPLVVLDLTLARYISTVTMLRKAAVHRGQVSGPVKLPRDWERYAWPEKFREWLRYLII
jgi:hypothetical protein